MTRAMQEIGVHRFVAVSAQPVASPDKTTLLLRTVAYPFLHPLFGGAYNDMRSMERVLAENAVD